MPDINDILSNLNSGYEQITDLIPNKVLFVDDFDDAKNEYDEIYNNNPLGNKFYPLSNGKYLWVGIDGTNNARNIRRYNSDFTLDETFASPTFDSGENGFVRDIVELSNGKLIAVGDFGSGTGKIIKLNADGTLDSSFDSGDHFNDGAFVIRLLSDGDLLIGGNFSSYNGTSTGRLVKISANGVLDTAFTDNASIIDNQVNAIKVDSSGDIYVGGAFGNYIVRLNSDGTVDTGFDVGSGFNSTVSSIEIDSNGKILVGGWFDNYKGASCNPGIVRLETNGDLDSGFSTEGSGLNNPGDGSIVQCISIQGDNKIVVGGWFNQYNGSRQGHIIRFNTDGTKDTDFDVGYGFGDAGDWGGQRVQSISIINNKIICVGNLKNYKGTALYGFARLNSDGSINPERLLKYTSFGIRDGYDDMYDGGNFINTNLTQLFDDIKEDSVNTFDSIPNTHSAAVDEGVFEDEGEPSYDNPVMDGVVKDGADYFGSGSSYFTNMYPGMFVLVAEDINIDEFSIGGDVGSDGSTQNASSVIIVHQGRTYTVFVKVNREGDGGEGADPSVNHLIIVPGEESGLTQLINEDGDDYDDHCIQGLSGRSSVYYILVAREEGNYLSNSDAKNIAMKFLEVIEAGCGETTVELELSPDNPETIPNYRFDGEGNMDTAIVVDPITGKRRSIQRTGYFETLDECGNRRVVAVNDGGTLTNVPTSWNDALSSILTVKYKNYLFINNSYVDYVEDIDGDNGHEANNLMAFMDSVNISYETFTDISFSNLSGSDSKLLIPELASGNLLPDLSVDAIASIESFVSGGGDLIVFEPCSGDLVDLLNNVFNLTLGEPGGGESCGGITDPISLTGEGASLLPGISAEIPNNNGSNSIDTTTFPAGSIVIYEGSGVNETVVAMIPYGSGKIYILGWDWYDAVPNGSQDGGWNDLLQAILES